MLVEARQKLQALKDGDGAAGSAAAGSSCCAASAGGGNSQKKRHSDGGAATGTTAASDPKRRKSSSSSSSSQGAASPLLPAAAAAADKDKENRQQQQQQQRPAAAGNVKVVDLSGDSPGVGAVAAAVPNGVQKIRPTGPDAPAVDYAMAWSIITDPRRSNPDKFEELTAYLKQKGIIEDNDLEWWEDDEDVMAIIRGCLTETGEKGFNKFMRFV